MNKDLRIEVGDEIQSARNLITGQITSVYGQVLHIQWDRRGMAQDATPYTLTYIRTLLQTGQWYRKEDNL